MNPTDLIVLFKPARAAELIGNPDALALLKVYWQKAADSAFVWAMNDDLSQPWCYADPAARGQVLVDYYSEEVCARLHEYGEAKAHTYRRLVTMTGFDGRQFHRDEIARWLDAMGIDSDYAFRLTERDMQGDATPDEGDSENGGAKLRWTETLAWEAWDMRQKLRSQKQRNFAAKVAEHYGVSTRRLNEIFTKYGLM